jgi:hypothetical protein
MPWLAFHDRLMNRMIDFPMPDKSGSGEFSPVCKGCIAAPWRCVGVALFKLRPARLDNSGRQARPF